jgi:hypothetical protein
VRALPHAGRYDFFADRAHHDRFQREFGSVWKPLHGDTRMPVDGYTPAAVASGATSRRRGMLADALKTIGAQLQVPGGEQRDIDDVAREKQRDQGLRLAGLPRRLQGEREQLQVRERVTKPGSHEDSTQPWGSGPIIRWPCAHP